MGFANSEDQRNALYRHLVDQLHGFDDLLNAVDNGDVEAAYRLGRKFSDGLRLIQDELGWGEDVTSPIALRNIPPVELNRILTCLRGEVAGQYEDAGQEQEAFRRPWDEAGLVRDLCDEILPALDLA